MREGTACSMGARGSASAQPPEGGGTGTDRRRCWCAGNVPLAGPRRCARAGAGSGSAWRGVPHQSRSRTDMASPGMKSYSICGGWIASCGQ